MKTEESATSKTTHTTVNAKTSGGDGTVNMVRWSNGVWMELVNVGVVDLREFSAKLSKTQSFVFWGLVLLKEYEFQQLISVKLSFKAVISIKQNSFCLPTCSTF